MKEKKNKPLIQTVLLIIILAILVWVYFSFSQNNKKAEASSSKDNLITPFRKSSIQTIRIKSRDIPEPLLLTNNRNIWYLTSPLQDKADPESIDSALTAILSFKSDRVFNDITKEDIESFGLDNPQIIITLSDLQKEILYIAIGAQDSSGAKLYMQVSRNPLSVYLIPIEQFTSILKMPDQYRDKDLFNIPPEDISSVEIISKDKKSVLLVNESLSNQNFILKKPVLTDADDTKVKTLILGFYALAASQFITNHPSQPSLKEYGLLNPEYTVIIKSENGTTNWIRISSTSDKSIFTVFSSLKDSIVTIQSENLQELLTTDPSNLILLK